MPVLRTLAARLRIRFLEISRVYGPPKSGTTIGVVVLEFPKGIASRRVSSEGLEWLLLGK